MRTESWLFLGSAAFFAAIGLVYWFVSYENAGSTLLALGFVAVLLVALYLVAQARRLGPRPEDRPDALPADGAGEVGYFPGRSFWPLGAGAGATLVALGLIFGIWLVVAGGALLVASVIGQGLHR